MMERSSMTKTKGAKPQRGIQSIDVGTQILVALVDKGKPMALAEIARQAAMSPANAHAYLVSFAKAGLVKQDSETSRYWLGPLALKLGLAALDRLEPVTEATAEAVELAELTNLGVTLCVWGNRGPAVVRFDRPAYPIHVSINIGTVLSVLNTVTGKVFAAYMPANLIERFVADEHAAVKRSATSMASVKGFFKELENVRAAGVGCGRGIPIPGIDSLCAPVFDSRGQIVLAITLLGPEGVFDAAVDGDVARMLKERADAVSHRLGYVAERGAIPTFG